MGSSLIFAICVLPIGSASGQDSDPYLTSLQQVMRALAVKQIRGNLPVEKMFDLCLPDSRCSLGRFVEYEFVCQPGYGELTIIAKDGVLKRAIEWSCTHTRTHFNEFTPEDEKEYQRLLKDNLDEPFERCIGRRGWYRPRMRDWMRGQ